MAKAPLNVKTGMALSIKNALLEIKAKTAKQLAEELGEKSPSVSSILSALYYAGYANRTKKGMEFFYTLSKRRTPRQHPIRRNSCNQEAADETLIDINSLTAALEQHETYRATLDLIVDMLEEIGMCKRI